MAFTVGQSVRITPVQGFSAGLAPAQAFEDTVVEAAFDNGDGQRITVTFGTPPRTRSFDPDRMYDFRVTAL